MTDWYHQHKTGDSFQKWYADHKNKSDHDGLGHAAWYQAHKGYGNFSMADWKEAHGLRSVMSDHNRLEMLAELSSRLDGYASENERCGLECWMAQFRHRDQLAAVHRWFKTNRGHTKEALESLNMQILQTEAWYAAHKSVS
jgi:hypothetical protein